MILNIRVIPKASRNFVKEEGGSFKVYLTQAPHEGLANKQLIETLSGHFKVKKYQVRIIKGGKSRNKTVEIDATGNTAGK
ncbi:MAG: DUF167 domain-containing protein [Candidatus Omnitrophica bacterium]|nr:DUF167 domain-containing protein [Candidatus Omnitrophota bacterium]